MLTIPLLDLDDLDIPEGFSALPLGMGCTKLPQETQVTPSIHSLRNTILLYI